MPAITAPKKWPMNWKKLYTPVAVPLVWGVVSCVTSEGKIGSKTLNPMKKRNTAGMNQTNSSFWEPTPNKIIETK